MRKSSLLFLFGILLCPQLKAQADDMQTIRGFAIDRQEVNIGQFARFVQATGTVTFAEKAGGGSTYEGGWVQRKAWNWRTPYGLPANDKEPAVHLTYYEAQAFCKWADKRLPTDAEWMEAAYTERRAKPASGFVAGMRYPYPTGISPQGANCLGDCGPLDTLPNYSDSSVTSRGRGHSLTGSTRAGVNGLQDMGGNVWEWTDNGKNGASSPERPTRGGSWWYGAEQMHHDHLQSKPASTAVVYIGFRCAKSL